MNLKINPHAAALENFHPEKFRAATTAAAAAVQIDCNLERKTTRRSCAHFIYCAHMRAAGVVRGNWNILCSERSRARVFRAGEALMRKIDWLIGPDRWMPRALYVCYNALHVLSIPYRYRATAVSFAVSVFRSTLSVFSWALGGKMGFTRRALFYCFWKLPGVYFPPGWEGGRRPEASFYRVKRTPGEIVGIVYTLLVRCYCCFGPSFLFFFFSLPFPFLCLL